MARTQNLARVRSKFPSSSPNVRGSLLVLVLLIALFLLIQILGLFDEFRLPGPSPNGDPFPPSPYSIDAVARTPTRGSTAKPPIVHVHLLFGRWMISETKSENIWDRNYMCSGGTLCRATGGLNARDEDRATADVVLSLDQGAHLLRGVDRNKTKTAWVGIEPQNFGVDGSLWDWQGSYHDPWRLDALQTR